MLGIADEYNLLCANKGPDTLIVRSSDKPLNLYFMNLMAVTGDA